MRPPPTTEAQAHQLRADLSVAWLLAGPGGVVERRFCRACAPSGLVGEVRCRYCADGPLLTGELACADAATDPGMSEWLRAQGWRVDSLLTCPRCALVFGWSGRS